MKPIQWVLVIGFAAVVAVWYFGYYDTAAAKCDRGDLGACTVLATQQAQERAEFEAQQAAEQEQRIADLSYQGACLLVADGHDATIYVVGADAQQTCDGYVAGGTFVGQHWTQGGGADALYDGYIVCTVDYCPEVITVYDTGMALIGTDVCDALGA